MKNAQSAFSAMFIAMGIAGGFLLGHFCEGPNDPRWMVLGFDCVAMFVFALVGFIEVFSAKP